MLQDDNVVVLGGRGFIGGELIRQLRGRVRSLTVVGRTKGALIAGGGVDYIEGDVEDAAVMMEVLAGANVVVQLTIEKDFVRSSHNVAKACLRHNVRRLIFASSSDALYLGSRTSGDCGLVADGKPHLRNPYSRGKVVSERIFLMYHSTHRLPVVIVRPAIVVGLGGKLTHGGLGKWKSSTALFGWGRGDNQLPFVLVEDVASAMIAAIDKQGIEGKAFNLSGDVRISAKEWVQLLRERSHRNFRFFSRNLRCMQLTVAAKALVKRTIGCPSEFHHYRDMISSSMLTPINNGEAKLHLGWKPNADRELFIRKAIDLHLPKLNGGDLRLETGD